MMSDVSTTEILTVDAAARARRSIRSYRPEPIPASELATILEVVRLAPSAFNLQPWRFVTVESPEVREALTAAAHNQRQVRSAPLVLVLYTDMQDTLATLDRVVHPNMPIERQAEVQAYIRNAFAGKSEAEREAWGAEQGFIALGYLLLTAEAHGYQTSPMAGFDAESVKRLLGLPTHVRVVALVAIGRGAESGFPHHRIPLEQLMRVA